MPFAPGHGGYSGTPAKREVVAGGVLAFYAILRTIWPLRFSFSPSSGQLLAERPSVLDVTFEVGLCVAVVLSPGRLASPFLLSLGAAVFIAGLRILARRPRFRHDWFDRRAWRRRAGRVAQSLARLCGYRAGCLSRGVGHGGFLQRLAVTPRHRENTSELERLRALSEVEPPLIGVHARAAALPASLNLKAAVANTISRLRDLLQPDVVVLFLADPTAERGHWEVVVADGLELPASVRQGSYQMQWSRRRVPSARCCGPSCRR